MASLALVVSIIVLITLLIGPISYLSAKFNLPVFMVYILSLLSIMQGMWFCSIAIPIWYMGFIPIYFGFISIAKMRNRNSRNET